MLDPKERHKLLMADRTRDPIWIAAVIEKLCAANQDIGLLDIEMALRDGAAQAHLIAIVDRKSPTHRPFRIVIGMKGWINALAAASLSSAANRALLAVISWRPLAASDDAVT